MPTLQQTVSLIDRHGDVQATVRDREWRRLGFYLERDDVPEVCEGCGAAGKNLVGISIGSCAPITPGEDRLVAGLPHNLVLKPGKSPVAYAIEQGHVHPENAEAVRQAFCSHRPSC